MTRRCVLTYLGPSLDSVHPILLHVGVVRRGPYEVLDHLEHRALALVLQLLGASLARVHTEYLQQQVATCDLDV